MILLLYTSLHIIKIEYMYQKQQIKTKLYKVKLTENHQQERHEKMYITRAWKHVHYIATTLFITHQILVNLQTDI